MSVRGSQAPTQVGIEPHTVLEQLDPLLGQTGCIKSAKEISKLVSLMKGAQLLVVRCVLLNIIKATKAPSTLDRFMYSGWPVLNMWLAEAKKTQDVAVLVEILQVLQKLPVSVAALKQGNMGKLIKQLSKQEHPEVKNLAGDLLSKWMAIFKEGQAATKTKPPTTTLGSEGTEKDVDKISAPQGAATDDAPPTPTKLDKEKKERPKKRESRSKAAAALPPVEAKPPPGPLVALGRRDKPLKRPRDFPQKIPIPPEKKVKPLSSLAHITDDKGKGKVLVESEGFMNALSSQAAKMKEKKIKKPKTLSLSSKSLMGGDGEVTTPTPTSADAPEPMDTSQQQEETPVEGQKSKKRVSWAEESNLVMVYYFEMDESERAIVREHGSFVDAAHREKMREREALESGLMFSRDRLLEMAPWQRPGRIEGSLELVERGVNSEQRRIQKEREEKVLAQLFLSKSSLPQSPAEPDPEPDAGKTEPKHIPLMEPSMVDGQQSSPSFPSPSSITALQVPPGSPLQSPATTIHQAQSLINFYNENKNSHTGPPQPDVHMLPPVLNPQPTTFHPPPHLPPFHGNGPAMPPPADYYNGYQQQGFPPSPGPDWNGPGSGFYGEFGGGGGAPPIRRGMRGNFRGRGRGFFPTEFSKGLHPDAFSKICKHFVTHGCRMGNKCRFIHCTPSQLAQKLSSSSSSSSSPQADSLSQTSQASPLQEGEGADDSHVTGHVTALEPEEVDNT